MSRSLLQTGAVAAGRGVHARRWLGGFLLATGLMWAGAWYFLDSIAPHELDPAIGRLVAPAGSRVRFRSEGWAVTAYGRHGIAGVPDLTAGAAPRVAIWGDSFVEGVHVADGDKMAQQLTALWRERRGAELLGVGIGRGDRSVADVWALLPRYEALTRFAVHFVVLASVRDACPDGVLFRSEPGFQLVERQRRQPLPGLRRALDAARLEFLWRPFWSLYGRGRNPLNDAPLRLRPGPAPPADRPAWDWSRAAAVDPAAWDFLAGALRERTARPLVLVYAPPVPRLEGGRIVADDPGRPYAARLAASCRRAGLGFLDLSGRFVRFQAASGRFPRGFPNSVPGRGHLNPDGHRLVAEAICDWLEAHPAEATADAVHAD